MIARRSVGSGVASCGFRGRGCPCRVPGTRRLTSLQFKGIAFWALPTINYVVFITIIASCAFILLEQRKFMPLAGVQVNAGPTP